MMLHPSSDSIDMHRIALGAGALYLIIILGGMAAEFAVRMPLITAGDASATAAAIQDAPGRWRAGFFADSVMVMADVALAVVLYIFFRGGQPVLALMAMIFRLVQAALLATNMLVAYAVLLIPDDAGTVMLLVDLQAHGYDLGLIFFGVNSLLTAVLLIRSPITPSPLGVLIGAAGVVYLAGSYARFLAPELHAAILPAYVVPLVAETGFAFWLVYFGLGRKRAAAN